MNSLHSSLSALLDFFLPRRCPSCGRELARRETMLCAACWMNLELVGHTDWSQNQHIMAWADYPFVCRAGAYAIYKRKNVAARLVHNLKYRHHYPAGNWMGQLAGHALKDSGLFDGIEVIIPIPITFGRKMHRGFNQSHMIALGLSEELGIPVAADALRCTRHGTSHTHFSYEQRLRHLNADLQSDTDDTISALITTFGLRSHALERLQGRHILLVDDVITTGSTIRAALHALRDIPDITVTVFAWSWV